MNILIIYDSVFGNTEKVAQELYDTLKENNKVEIRKVDKMNTTMVKEIDLIILGSPTRGFSPTKPMTQFVKSLETDNDAMKVAIYDTRIDYMQIKSRLARNIVHKGGYANQKMAKVIKNKGIRVVEPLEAFYVIESEGPLKDGELKRAKDWIEKIQ
ncbi:MAG: flavodoxin domain-containing protein [Clostridia bacterium]|nr:flavodoxin domain-containing protein [Clostridia bacterium]